MTENCNEESGPTALSRRALFASAGMVASAATVGRAVIGSPVRAAAAASADIATIRRSACLHAVTVARSATRYGVTAPFDSVVSSRTGLVRPASTNLLAANLPLRGGDLASNRLPVGFEWHSAPVPKKLVKLTENGIVFDAETVSNPAGYFGGVRTTSAVVAPGRSILISMRAALLNLQGDPNASIYVALLRPSDQSVTDEARIFNRQDVNMSVVHARLTAPSGGSEGYRLVIGVRAGSKQVGQSVRVDISKFVVIDQPSVPRIGNLHSLPPYFLSTLSRQDTVIRPEGGAGDYYVLVRTDTTGWIVGSVTRTDPSAPISLLGIFGPSANVVAQEIYVFRPNEWEDGWFDVIAPPTSWVPLRFREINGDVGLSRPESPSRLARATGRIAAHSGPPGDMNRRAPWLEAPAQEWAAAFASARAFHIRFQVDSVRYVGDVGPIAGVRSEVLPEPPVEFNRDYWISYRLKINNDLTDTTGDRINVLNQFRYTKNAQNDFSRLSPDFALEQLPGRRLRIRYRTDGGVPDLSGDAQSSRVTTRTAAEVAYMAGRWHSVVLRVRFSAGGTGLLGFWFDGERAFESPVEMGYMRDLGPQLRFGAYKFSESRASVEFAHFEYSTASLMSRVAVPLPI